MSRYVHDALRSLRNAMGALFSRSDYVNRTNEGQSRYSTDANDPHLPMVVLFLTQKPFYRASSANRRLRRLLDIESPEEMRLFLDPYVDKGILTKSSQHMIVGGGKVGGRKKEVDVVYYKLSTEGYNLSLELLEEKAKKDKRSPRHIPIGEIGLRGDVVKTLKLQGIVNLDRLLNSIAGTWYRANSPIDGIGETGLKEIQNKVRFYRSRMQQ